MNNLILITYATMQSHRVHLAHRLAPHGNRGDRGEGVISAAIAVLVIAFLGALMWVGFKTMFTNTQKRVDNQVQQIGN